MENKLSAFVFGGTGTIGSGIVKALAKEPKFNKVTLFGRRNIEFPIEEETTDYGKFNQEIIDFDNLGKLEPTKFQGYDVGFYALGVSSAKVDEVTYRKVEHDYTMAIAKIVYESGVPHFNWVSGRGADKDSWFLFGKVKAQVEAELAEIDFPRLSIYQPAMVLNADCRIANRIVNFVDPGHKASIDPEKLGSIIVKNSLQSSNKKAEVLRMADIRQLEKDFK